VKNGRRNNRQRYKCGNCGRQTQNRKRKTKKLKLLWKQYIWQRQTAKQLSESHRKSEKWIRLQLDKAPLTNFHLHPQPVVGIADVTFWGREYGVLVFRSYDLKQNLYWTEVQNETVAVYQEAKQILEELGFTFDAIVLDGKSGIKQVFKDIPIQHCQFHQIKTINKYLTRRPKLQAAIELRTIALALTKVKEEYFTILVSQWHEKWQDFLKERTIHSEDPRRWFYTHKRIRSAYRSLKTNLPYLFTYQKHPELHIPNTTNSLDGSFGHLKQIIGIHRGLTRERRWRLIQEVLAK
jgi:hypothetical protein